MRFGEIEQNEESRKLPKGVSEKLDHYVYFLVDPKTQIPFYVGKGQDGRVFDHVNHVKNKIGSASDKDKESKKTQRIEEILESGEEPVHIIHRHGLNEKKAIEIEAALIDVFDYFDALPTLTNMQGGHESKKRGPATVGELIGRYDDPMGRIDHKVIAFKIPRSYGTGSIYNAVRVAWNVDIKNAKKADYVFAVKGGICLGVFKIDKEKEEGGWSLVTQEKFPDVCRNPEEWISMKGKYGFFGCVAEDEVQDRYKFKRFPDDDPWTSAQGSFHYYNC